MLDFNSSTVSCLWSAQDKVSFKSPETGCSGEVEEATGCAGYNFKKRKSLWTNVTMKDDIKCKWLQRNMVRFRFKV